MKILRWFSEGETGLSSKAIALTALGEMPKNPSYPSDGADFMRCIKLLELCPEAKTGLDELAVNGGPVWAALIKRWEEISAACRHDDALFGGGEKRHAKYRCYDLMRSIISAAEK